MKLKIKRKKEKTDISRTYIIFKGRSSKNMKGFHLFENAKIKQPFK